DCGRAPTSVDPKRKAAERSRTAPTERARLEAAGPCSRGSSGCKSIRSPPRVGNWSYWPHAVISTGLVTSKRDTVQLHAKKKRKSTLDKANKKRNTVNLHRGGLCLQCTPLWRSILRFGAGPPHQLPN